MEVNSTVTQMLRHINGVCWVILSQTQNLVDAHVGVGDALYLTKD